MENQHGGRAIRITGLCLAILFGVAGRTSGQTIRPFTSKDDQRTEESSGYLRIAGAARDENKPAPPIGDNTGSAEPPAEVESPDDATGESTSEPDRTSDAGEQLRQRLGQLRQSVAGAELPETATAALNTQLDRANEDLEAAKQQTDLLRQVVERTNSLRADAEKLRAGSPPPDLSRLGSLSEVELETRLATLQVSFRTEQDNLAQLQTAVTSIQDRRQELQQQLSAAEETLSEPPRIDLPPETPAALAEPLTALIIDARQLRSTTERAVAQSSLGELDARLSLNLPTLRLVNQQNRVNRLTAESKAIEEQLAEIRQRESQRRVRQARVNQQFLDTIEDPAIRNVLEASLDYAQRNEKLITTTIPDLTTQLDNEKQTSTDLLDEAEKIRNRVTQFGPTGAVGREMLHFAGRLPNAEKLAAQRASINTELSQLRDDQFQYQADLAETERLLINEQTEGRSAYQEALKEHSALLTSLNQNCTRRFTLLSDMEAELRKQQRLADTWADYVAEEALWFPSHTPLWNTDLKTAPSELVYFCRRLVNSLTPRKNINLGSVLLFLVPMSLAFLLLLFIQSRARKGLEQLAEIAGRRVNLAIRPTFRAVLLTVALACEWPLFAMLVGNAVQLFGQENGDVLLIHVGMAVVRMGMLLLWANLLRHSLRPGGLCEAHFGWNSESARALRTWLRRSLIWLAVPVFLFFVERAEPTRDAVVERCTFLAILLIAQLRVLILLRGAAERPIRDSFRAAVPAVSLRYLAALILAALPVFFTVLTVAGFHYTATALFQRLGTTVAFGTAALLGYELLARTIRLLHMRARLAQARERARERDQQGDDLESLLPQVPADEVRVEFFGLQAGALARNVVLLVFLGTTWATWADVLPALKKLNERGVWDVREEVTVYITDDEGNEVSELKTQVRSVTVGNLILACFLAIGTWSAVSHLPALLELVVLSRLTMEHSLRYAISTVSRYALLVIGVLLVSNLVGLRWSQIQWLAAGLSVGLGFGLQEVFANFVSGVIILFERPVRIGDVVTIDGVTGIVSRIRIRATSITDWDRKEYIVPNREFVTGKVLNWTLTDTTNRFFLNVGVAYGTDTDRAMSILTEIVTEHPDVLDDPAPVVTIEGFNASDVGLGIRGYLPNLDRRLAVITELYGAIHRRFEQEGISIPFPQRDLHIITGGPLASADGSRPAA